jgi:ubiquinone/menaquinone biosynthesis C-methylase UbiE
MADKQADTKWDDQEIVLTNMSPDTKFVFDRMTQATIDAVGAKPGEEIMDLACGRAIDAFNIALKGPLVFGLEPSDVMLKKSLEWVEQGKTHPVIFLRAIAEYLPLKESSLDKLVCKGAIDHFVDVNVTLAEVARILRPGGKLVISVANFDSLSCRLAKIYDWFFEKIHGKKRAEHPSYLPPDDHNFKFDKKFLTAKLELNFKIESLSGLSLLWCFPKWGALLEKLSPGAQSGVLNFLDRIAYVFPSLSDVMVVIASPKK